MPAPTANMLEDVVTSAALHPSLLLHWQYSMKILNVPVRIKQNRSSPTIPGSPMNAQLLKYRHSPFTVQKTSRIKLSIKFRIETGFIGCWPYLFVEFFGTLSDAHRANDPIMPPVCSRWSIMYYCQMDRHTLDRNRIDIPSILCTDLNI